MPTLLILPRTRRERFMDRVFIVIGIALICSVPILLAKVSIDYVQMESKVLELENKLKECRP